MVWLVQNCRSIKCLQFLKPPELRGEGVLRPPGPPTRALPTHAPLTTNPGSAPDYIYLMDYNVPTNLIFFVTLSDPLYNYRGHVLYRVFLVFTLWFC